MKLNKSALWAFAAVVVIFSLSSCNRGVGCPSDFSMLNPLSILSVLF